ncbi:MAG: Arsenical pump-driving ATPase [Symbiobacteriaceae bacterium]|jgi:arsenite-transporting ATPase|nr:Arsenical pump-driving ATPase [Symbiobacteriaceae bacterium]
MRFIDQAARFLFFTGKGGVGKTSLSCATALRLADMGRRVLLISTDPASNLDDVLQVKLGPAPQPIPGVVGLHAANLDPEAAATAYREKVVGPYRDILPEAALTNMEEQLSGACTMEIAAFDEFALLLGNPEATADFDHVVFDTAPTGHTLRLLSLPMAWQGFIDTNTHGGSCLGPLAGLQEQRELYHAAVQALADGTRTTLLLVSRPERGALTEAARASGELAELGVSNQWLLINGIFHARDQKDPIAAALELRGNTALRSIPDALAGLPREEIPLVPRSLVGIEALRQMLAPVDMTIQAGDVHVNRTDLPAPLVELVNALSGQGRGVIMTMGKGGVGKTTMAAAIAVELASRGHRVHLSTTDPAAHVAAVVDGGLPGLTVSRIDPKAEVADYTAEVMGSAGKDLDAEGRALLEEDLRSPCTEEIAVFRAFAAMVEQGRDGFVILDTAPTGHTILLLDATQAYHREVSTQADHTPESVKQLLPRLRDQAFTRILLVTLPEATPVFEAERLQADLRRAGIEPFGWVINQSLLAGGTRDPLLQQRASYELPLIEQIRQQLAARCALVPWLAYEPVGTERLLKLLRA